MAPKKKTKAKANSRQRKNPPTTTTTEGKKSMTPKPKCLLLTLPAELRHRVYEYVAHSNASFSIKEGRVHNASTAALAPTSKQFRQKVIPVFDDYVATQHRHFNTRVRDYEFEELEMFLDDLVPLQGTDEPRQLTINIDYGVDAIEQDLRDWLDYCQSSEVMRSIERNYRAVFTWEDRDECHAGGTVVQQLDAVRGDYGENEEVDALETAVDAGIEEALEDLESGYYENNEEVFY